MSAEIPALLLIPGVAPEQIRIVLLLILIVMANRAKRKAVLKEKLEREALYKKLFYQGRLRKEKLISDRHAQRHSNRRVLRLYRKGIPAWASNICGIDEVMELMPHLSKFRIRGLVPFPLKEFPEGDLSVEEGKRLLIELIDHLFLKYPVPHFTYEGWFDCDLTLARWFVHIAQGGNLRTAPGMPLRLTKKMAHHALKRPDGLSFYESLRYGQVRGYGGSDFLARLILRTRMDFDPEKQDFWEELIQWMIPHEETLSDCYYDEEKILVNYLRAIKFQGFRSFDRNGSVNSYSEPNFSIKGRSFAKLLKTATEFLSAQSMGNDIRRNLVIKQVRDFVHHSGYYQNSRVTYRIRPLLTAHDVLTEGRVMSHCVDENYWKEILAGKTSIWSLTEHSGGKPPRKLLTIEVNRGFRILQVYGKANRLPTTFEKYLVLRWANREQLTTFGWK